MSGSTPPPTKSPTFRDIGIECQHSPSVGKTLTYESPVKLGNGSFFHGSCSIGAFTYINGDASIVDTTIGRYCSIADRLSTAPGQHPTESFSTHPFIFDPHDRAARLGAFPSYKKILGLTPPTYAKSSKRAHVDPRVTIGHDVWIGTRVIILNGVTIGHGAVIGAGSIVTRDVAPYTIVAGSPARLIRPRFEADIVKRLLELSWWDYEMSHVSNRVDYGDVLGVIKFMTELIEGGQLEKLTPEVWKIDSANSNAKITRLK